MSGERTKKRSGSLSEVFRALRSAISSAYNLAPGAVGCMTILVGAVVALVVRWSAAREATVLLLVLSVALLVYFSTKSYGEAALALAAGLFSVYSVEWTTPNFLSFITIWLVFTAVALLASSIHIASQVEDIYRQAALLSAGPAGYKQREKELREIAGFKGLGMLNAKEKAEVLRLLCFRRISLELMRTVLEAVETVSVVTKVSYLRVAGLIADVTKAAEIAGGTSAQGVADTVVQTMRDAAVAPSDFFSAFESSRHLMFRPRVGVERYFIALRRVLESGARPADVGEFLISELGVSGV